MPFLSEFSTPQVLRIIVSNSCLHELSRYVPFPHIPLD
jgi:hypothetical protein